MRKISTFIGCYLAIIFIGASFISAQTNTQAYTIYMTKYDYSPQKIVVVLGDTIKFVNIDDKPHWPKGDIFDSQKEIKQGESWEHKTQNVGEFLFSDYLFPKRKGVLVVDKTSFSIKENDSEMAQAGKTIKNTDSIIQKITNLLISIKNGIISLLKSIV